MKPDKLARAERNGRIAFLIMACIVAGVIVMIGCVPPPPVQRQPAPMSAGERTAAQCLNGVRSNAFCLEACKVKHQAGFDAARDCVDYILSH